MTEQIKEAFTKESSQNTPEGNDKSKKKKYKVENWYADRFLSITVQRNILFLFSILSSIGVLAALLLVKTMYEQRAIDPYLIEVEPQTGIASVVDYKTKKEYTDQEVIKEAMIVKYLKIREGYKEDVMIKNAELIRIFSSKNVYDIYTRDLGGRSDAVRNFGREATAEIKIKSINYLLPNKVQVRFIREIRAKDKTDIRKEKYTAIVGFIFADLELNIEERWENPFGFQVISYILQLDEKEE